MEIHERLRGMREDRDLNQTQLGKFMHMSQRRVSRLETQDTTITAEDIKQYCLFFNVSADYILGLPDLPYPKRR